MQQKTKQTPVYKFSHDDESVQVVPMEDLEAGGNTLKQSSPPPDATEDRIDKRVREIFKDSWIFKNPVLTYQQIDELKLQKPKDLEPSFPAATVLICLVHLCFTATLIFLNNGLEEFNVNPFYGTTRDQLVKWGAKYYPEAKNHNEYWRWVSPLALHAGIIHVIVAVVMHSRTMFYIERDCGWWRTMLIYLINGIASYTFSMLFLPGVPQVGSTPALTGMLSILIGLAFQNMSATKNVGRKLAEYCFWCVFILGFGTLPFVDNFANLAGFIVGIFSGLVLHPSFNLTLRKGPAVICSFVCLVIMIGLCISLLIGQGESKKDWCGVICSLMECMPKSQPWCHETYQSP